MPTKKTCKGMKTCICDLLKYQEKSATFSLPAMVYPLLTSPKSKGISLAYFFLIHIGTELFKQVKDVGGIKKLLSLTSTFQSTLICVTFVSYKGLRVMKKEISFILVCRNQSTLTFTVIAIVKTGNRCIQNQFN